MASGSTHVSVTPGLVELHLQGYAPRVEVLGRDRAAVTLSEGEQRVGLPLTPAGSEVFAPSVSQLPDVVVQAAIIQIGGTTSEGQLVAGVAIAWFEIISRLRDDPEFLFRIHWRDLEEIIAGAYERAGWSEVLLTPRSGDGGRDIIATREGVGSVRIIDQIKAYKPGRLVTAEEVRAMLGVLEAEQNVSKGLVTTTSAFAPGIRKDPRLTRYMPYRLDLKDGPQLRDWLVALGSAQAKGPSQ